MPARRLALVSLILLAAAPAAVPQAFRGAWARDGRCSAPDDRLTITATTATLGRAPTQPVIFDRDDGPHGENALHWAQEGNADNFVAGPAGTLIHNPEGYDMGQPEIYHRCPR
jgi:hypothetical protein